MAIRNPKSLDIDQFENTGFDTQVELIRAALLALPWLSNSLGRAFPLPRQMADGRIRSVPKVFSGNEEYTDALPNDQLQSFSFIVGRDPATINEADLQPFSRYLNFTRNTDIIFFVRFDLIDPLKPYPFTDVLMEDIMQIIQGLRGVQVNDFVTETMAGVYAGFSLIDVDEKFLHFPFGGIRLNVDVSYQVDCNPTALVTLSFPYVLPHVLS